MIGEIDRRVTFLARTDSTDAHGGTTTTWSVDFTTWADVTTLKGNERFEASQLIGVADIKIRIRHRDSINNKLRFQYDGDNYDIYSITEVERKMYLDILGRVLKST